MAIRVIILTLAVLIWLALYLTGNDSHKADGIIFFGLVGIEAVVIWLQSRKAPVK
jgi:hypothetical protein